MNYLRQLFRMIKLPFAQRDNRNPSAELLKLAKNVDVANPDVMGGLSVHHVQKGAYTAVFTVTRLAFE